MDTVLPPYLHHHRPLGIRISCRRLSSIFRSAVMFTCIAIGDSLSKQASIFNSLAASAFLLLCYNPYWLWDAGFQLSYTAVASLALFQQTVYNAFTISQRWLDAIWKLSATTIAAQILTLPLILFLFHQFPLFFLITNLVAIPLSSLILLGEILLCLLSFLPFLAIPTGTLLSWLIKIMNGLVETIDGLLLRIHHADQHHLYTGHTALWNYCSNSHLDII